MPWHAMFCLKLLCASVFAFMMFISPSASTSVFENSAPQRPQSSPHTIFVSPTGSDSNSGATPTSALATCSAAVTKINALLSTPGGAPPSGIEVVFASGTYPLTSATACGEVMVKATEASPVIFRAASSDAVVVFDGTTYLDTSSLAPVINATVKALLNPNASGVVMALPVASTSGWTGVGQQLQWGELPLTPSVWPNTGLGYILNIYDEGAVYCPGRTKGPPPKCKVCTGSSKTTPRAPCGANFSLSVNPTGDWERELMAGPGFGGDVVLDGYIGVDWFHERHPIVLVAKRDTTTSVQLGDSSHYGVCEALDGRPPGCGGGDSGGAPGRFRVRGLLSEVDVAGEFFFDTAASVLYLIPPPQQAKGRLGFWSGPGLISIVNSSFVTVRDFTVTGSGATAIQVVGGANNTVGGCTLKCSSGGVVLQGGHQNTVVGNDIYDVTGSHVSTSNNANESLAITHGELIPTNNLITNNHFTQVWLSDLSWSVSAGGLGDRFNNNLMHDAPGQLILTGGPLTMWDHNEVFNTGYAEGDGGIMYAHASLVHGYGQHIRENFLHHSLDVPGLIGRHAIQLDDHFGAISNCSHNILYKAAGIGIATSGAGNNVTGNLVMNTGMAIATSDLEDMTVNLPLYDNGTLKRGDKMDYVYNAETDLGVTSYGAMFKTALAMRFPSFAKMLSVNSTGEGWASAGATLFTNNVFINTSQGNICFEDAENVSGATGVHTWHCLHPNGPAGPTGRKIAPLTNASAFGYPVKHYLNWNGSVEGAWDWFPGSDQLEFVNESLGLDTRKMGLYCDGWRRSIPNASLYRPYIKHAFAGVSALPEHGHYTPEAAALRSGVRSGRALVLNFTVACPPVAKRDCEGVWLAWGECEANGLQMMRYTIEAPAIGGGTPCAWFDGHTAMKNSV